MDNLIASTEVELVNIDGRTFEVLGLTQRQDGTPIGDIAIDTSEAPLYRVEVRVRWRGPYGDERLSLDSTVLPE